MPGCPAGRRRRCTPRSTTSCRGPNSELPQRERTKHVHSLHPYLGKFVPQVAESLLRRGFAPGALIYDPFAGSGTTLVEANVLGMDAIGTDVSAFNCLLMRVKTERHDNGTLSADLERALAAPPPGRAGIGVAPRLVRAGGAAPSCRVPVGHRRARLTRDAVGGAVASRPLGPARPPRRPRPAAAPVLEPYHCHKHKRTCRPVGHAAQFLRRYAADTVQRLASSPACAATVT